MEEMGWEGGVGKTNWSAWLGEKSSKIKAVQWRRGYFFPVALKTALVAAKLRPERAENKKRPCNPAAITTLELPDERIRTFR